ncbi:cellular nucleic acid-binding protein [Anaeramoeba flamelloides]|uniref:Cellular nucleic acid-binding protein n=1 Tax=Anaeramoeba flamelloides TaxID=1746091 RepID=A0ABQ8YPD2_9EUKA|nr:cellular nucleic acid-binding protein [Anaeramoeba flamelloides]
MTNDLLPILTDLYHSPISTTTKSKKKTPNPRKRSSSSKEKHKGIKDPKTPSQSKSRRKNIHKNKKEKEKEKEKREKKHSSHSKESQNSRHSRQSRHTRHSKDSKNRSSLRMNSKKQESPKNFIARYFQPSNPDIKCFKCGKNGHMARDCPPRKNSRSSLNRNTQRSKKDDPKHNNKNDNKNNNENNQSKNLTVCRIYCGNCGMRGHRIENCQEPKFDHLTKIYEIDQKYHPKTSNTDL